MKNDITLESIVRPLRTFLKRSHGMLMLLVVTGGLIGCMLILNGIIIRSTDTSNISTTSSSTFDQETVKRLEELKTTDDGSAFTLPGGRINPFIE